VAYGVVILIGLVGLSLVKTDNLIMDDIRDDDPIKVDFTFLDTHFGGFRPFELVVTVKDTSETIWKMEHLEAMQKVEKYLDKEFGVELKGSVVQSLSVLNRSANSGNPKYFKLPEDNRNLTRFKRFLKIAGQGKMIRLMVDSTDRVTRITGGIPDWGNNKVTAKNEALFRFIEKEKLNEKLHFQLTGSAYLLDKNISYLSRSLLQGLAISITIVSLLMGLLYKSWRMMVISIIPNVLPLLVIAAVMGFTGLEIKTSTSIIFTIAFGIAVDDTIHLLGKFKLELMKGIGKEQALKNAITITGKAMILTTLILCSGFMLLLFSDFNGTFYMGLLLSLALLVALILDLTLLPVLIHLFYKESYWNGKELKSEE
jgi:predicted RND superfamily exporter protein